MAPVRGAALAAVALGFLAAYVLVPGPTAQQGGMSIEEGIRRIPAALSGETVIYYSYGEVPGVPDRQAPLDALDLALRTWEEHNPGTRFVHHEWSDVRIDWRMHGAATHSGLATCQSHAIRDRCILEISVGGTGCGGEYIQAEHYLLTNLIMHEVGHSLGIGHTAEEGHLMYSTEDPEVELDTRGYTVPAKYPDLGSQVAEYGGAIRAERAEYDRRYGEYDRLYGQYSGIPQSEYQEYLEIHSELVRERDRINLMVAEYNSMVERLNSMSAVMPCPAR